LGSLPALLRPRLSSPQLPNRRSKTLPNAGKSRITTGITSLRSTGATLYEPQHLQYLAMAYAELGQLDDAWRCIDDAIETIERSKERWCEAEAHRIAGEIALKSLARDPEKAEAYFDRALAVARQQRAKSWELRATMSMARLWRDRGMREEARDLLAPVYGWFTEGFDTLDLKEARKLLDGLQHAPATRLGIASSQT
jgi:predicted ATPase